MYVFIRNGFEPNPDYGTGLHILYIRDITMNDIDSILSNSNLKCNIRSNLLENEDESYFWNEHES